MKKRTIGQVLKLSRVNLHLSLQDVFDEEVLVNDEDLHSRLQRQKKSWLPILYYVLASLAIIGFVIYIVYFYEFTTSVK